MTRTGICWAYSAAASARPAARWASINDPHSALVIGSYEATLAWENQGSNSRRVQVCRGGSDVIGGRP